MSGACLGGRKTIFPLWIGRNEAGFGSRGAVSCVAFGAARRGLPTFHPVRLDGPPFCAAVGAGASRTGRTMKKEIWLAIIKVIGDALVAAINRWGG